jgi:hypothetical protein
MQITSWYKILKFISADKQVTFLKQQEISFEDFVSK